MMQDQERAFAEMFDEVADDPVYRREMIVMQLTHVITQRLADLGMQQKDLAERLGTSGAYVSKLLDGTGNFTVQKLVEIGLALGLEVDISFRGTDGECLAPCASSAAEIETGLTENQAT